jgi:hypothetical protein
VKLARKFILAAATMAVALGVWSWPGRAQNPAGMVSAGGFSLPIRKEGRLVTRLTGAATEPVSAKEVRVRQFRVETYKTDETPDLVGDAPECVVDLTSKNMSGPGRLTVSQAGGRFTLSGEGFFWNHDAGRLVLSNKVHTTMRLNPFNPSSP